MIGEGESKYNDVCTRIREEQKARGAVVIVLGGDRGHGCACQVMLPELMQLPDILRGLLAQAERDARIMSGLGVTMPSNPKETTLDPADLAGPTGRFPKGKVAPDDRGEIAIAFSVQHPPGLLRIDFGKPVSWLALPLDEAQRFLAKIQSQVEQLKAGFGRVD